MKAMYGFKKTSGFTIDSMKKFSLKNISQEQKTLRRRVLELSHKAKFSHLGSCLSALDLIDAVYTVKKKEEKFVLSNGHAGIALYVVLEKNGYLKDLHKKRNLSVHPDRDIKKGIHVSTGSLGQGLPIALGMALADRTKNVYCMISDGECEEGSIWESLKVAWKHKVTNLKIILNANGWAAYEELDLQHLKRRIQATGYDVVDLKGHDSKNIIKQFSKRSDKQTLFFARTHVDQFAFLNGQDAHYYVMTQEDYESAMNQLL